MHNARTTEWESIWRLRVAYGKPSSEEARDALFQHDDFVFYAGLQRLALQQLERLFNGLMGEAECSVVHRDHPAGLEIEEGFGGVGGTGMYVTKLWRIVGADREQR